MPNADPPSPAQLIMSRTSDSLLERGTQLLRNRLAVSGGQHYIDARLHRAPNESELSWSGKRASVAGMADADVNGLGSFGVSGRKDRTVYVNDAGRISGKIQQYLFKERVARDGGDERFLREMGGRNLGEVVFWQGVNEAFTWGQWCWVQTVRGAVAPSLRDRTRKDAVKWRLFPSLSVPDWFIDEDTGEVLWLITETFRENKADPFAPASRQCVRTLWRKADGAVEVSQFVADAGAGSGASDPTRAQQIGFQRLSGLNELPFALIGQPSPTPWWFDDVENIQASLLNLDSLYLDILQRTVFPQLVISTGTFENLDTTLRETLGAEQGQIVLKIVREMVRGVDTPIVESAEERGTTRFICPDTAAIAAIPNEIARKRALLFDMAGLGLFNKETRMVQTAESKQFDQLDTESTLKNRALVMQEAEERLVALSRVLDPSFKPYSPVWPSSFDVEDIAADKMAIDTVADLGDATPSMRKLALKAAVGVLATVLGHNKELIDAANREIDEADFSEERIPPEDQPMRIRANGETGDDDDDDGEGASGGG